MTIVIAGCGDLGTEAGLRFAAMRQGAPGQKVPGQRVLGLRRNASALPSGIEGVPIDLVREVPELPADTSTVVIAMSPDSRDAAGYTDAYLRAPAHVLDGLDRAGAQPRRVLFVSSTSVYGAIDDGRTLDEASPTAPRPVTGEITLEAEQRIRERVPGATVLRLSGLYGPGRNWLLDRVRAGSVPFPGGNISNCIHRDDAAAAIVHLCGLDAPEPLYIGTDTAPTPYAEVIAFLAAELGVPVPAVPRESRPGESRPGNLPPDAGTASGKRLSDARLRGTGFAPEYPTFREGYRAVLGGKGVRHA